MQQCSSAIARVAPGPMAMPEEIQSVTNSFLELVPGVPANQKNLKTLLRWIAENPQSPRWLKFSGEMMMTIDTTGTKKKPKLHAVLRGPERSVYGTGMNFRIRDPIADQTRPATETGLLETIVFLKKALDKYRTEGTCDTCLPPRKRLKADGMPKCEECMLNEAIGV